MKKEYKKKALIFALLILCFAGAAALFISMENNGLKNKESYHLASESKNAVEVNNVIYFGGEKYVPNHRVSTFLIFGVDSDGEYTGSGAYNNTDQADFLLLVVFDNKNKTYRLIHLNRDTIAPVDILGLDGRVVSTNDMQLALSHTYGDGMEKSCENTVKAVSSLLYGVKIDNYLLMTMDALVYLNDYIGGVSVQIPEDYSYVKAEDGSMLDERLAAGETVLFDGELALKFVRSRGSMADSTNIARMERQKLYMNSLIASLAESNLSDSKLLDAYDGISPYIVTDSSSSDFSSMYSNISSYSCEGIISPEGESIAGENFMEFYADDEKLRELVIDLFYVKVEY